MKTLEDFKHVLETTLTHITPEFIKDEEYIDVAAITLHHLISDLLFKIKTLNEKDEIAPIIYDFLFVLQKEYFATPLISDNVLSPLNIEATTSEDEVKAIADQLFLPTAPITRQNSGKFSLFSSPSVSAKQSTNSVSSLSSPQHQNARHELHPSQIPDFFSMILAQAANSFSQVVHDVSKYMSEAVLEDPENEEELTYLYNQF